MSKFEFFAVPRIIAGRGEFKRIGELVASFGRRPLVIHNISDASLIQRTTDLLSVAGDAPVFHRQSGEPQVSDVDAALAVARQNQSSVVIGLGGGSAIDLAKAVAALLTNGGHPLDYIEVVGAGQKIVRLAAPWIAVPTTAGTGAEATRNAVIAVPEKRFKASIRSEHLMARVAVIDPELAVNVRPEVTARSGMDALCQCIEAYTSNSANVMTHPLALRGIELAGWALLQAYHNGADIDAREAMAICALFSGIALTNAGLGAVHGFAAPLGANFPVPHGTVCAALLAPVMKANVRALREKKEAAALLIRYASVGRALSGRMDQSDEEAIDQGVETAARLAKQLAIPPLGDFGLTSKQVPEIVALAKKSSSMRYNPIVLSDAVLADVLNEAI